MADRFLLWEQGNPAYFAAWWIGRGENNLTAANEVEINALADENRLELVEHPKEFGIEVITKYSSAVYRVIA